MNIIVIILLSLCLSHTQEQFKIEVTDSQEFKGGHFISVHRVSDGLVVVDEPEVECIPESMVVTPDAPRLNGFGYTIAYIDIMIAKDEIRDQILSNYIRVRDLIFSGEAQATEKLLLLFTDDIQYRLTWNNNITYHGKEAVREYVALNYQEYMDINQCNTVQGEPSFYDVTISSTRVRFTVVRYHRSPVIDSNKLWKMRLVETEFHLVRPSGRRWFIQQVDILTSKEIRNH